VGKKKEKDQRKKKEKENKAIRKQTTRYGAKRRKRIQIDALPRQPKTDIVRPQ
jgi:hypothetical protein